MLKKFTKKDIDILEERGLWKASSFLDKIVKRLIRKKLPLEIRYIKQAHKIIFDTANQGAMAGKYRRDNPELKRIDNTILKIDHCHQIPNSMAQLDFELREDTKNLNHPTIEEDYDKIIFLAAKFSHRLACIHPFENGNGRASRLLINAILLRAGLPDIAIKKLKSKYLRAMCQADYGNFSLLEDIIIDGLIERKKKDYEILKKKEIKSFN